MESLSNFNRKATQIMRIMAILMSLFHVATSAIGSLPTMEQRSVHLGFAISLILMQKITKKSTKKWVIALDGVLVIFTVIISIYTFTNWKSMAERVASPSNLQLVFAVILLLALLYVTKIKLGWPLPIMSLIMILYALFGAYLPKTIGHKGYTIKRVLSQLYMGTEGLYGSILGISATYIFLFILFGALMEYSGAAKFFIDISCALFGRAKGSSAKVTTVACGIFGMVSGSATANVVAIGPITAPMMQKTGFSNRFAGSVIAVAGTGGQFMPPIMGAAAFIVAETLGIPYISVALAAFIPAVLYYAALWIAIDCRTSNTGIKSLPEEDIPDLKKVLITGSYLALPFLLLIFFLAIVRLSPMRSGFYAIIATIVISWFKKSTRMGLKKLSDSFYKGAMGSLDVAVVCSAAGIIISMLSLTGLGLKFSSLLIMFSMGNKLILLVLTAIAALILGMGMTATSVYIILSVLVAPALIKMGISPLPAHLFVYYFGILSAITPPVATASFAAASLVKDEPFKLGFSAWRLGLAGYIIPFMFIFSQELLFVGSPISIIRAIITSLIGVYALAAALEGYLHRKLSILMRIILFTSSILLIDSGFLTDVIGLVIVAVTSVYYKRTKLKESIEPGVRLE